MNITINFGEKIMFARQTKNFSQQDLAKKINISNSSICLYEKNRRKPRKQIQQKIAEQLELPIEYFNTTSIIDDTKILYIDTTLICQNDINVINMIYQIFRHINQKNLGKFLVKARAKKRLNQRKLAQLVKKDSKTMSLYETNKDIPCNNTIILLAKNLQKTKLPANKKNYIIFDTTKLEIGQIKFLKEYYIICQMLNHRRTTI